MAATHGLAGGAPILAKGRRGIAVRTGESVAAAGRLPRRDAVG